MLLFVLRHLSMSCYYKSTDCDFREFRVASADEKWALLSVYVWGLHSCVHRFYLRTQDKNGVPNIKNQDRSTTCQSNFVSKNSMQQKFSDKKYGKQ